MSIGEKTYLQVFEHRPWGSFYVLDEGIRFKVKRIEVLPNKRLSYQKHQHRKEHWFVVQGTAKTTIDGIETTLEVGDSINIEIGAFHRVENPDDNVLLIFIEVQRGDYLGEDDIIRLHDDFDRPLT